MNDFNYELQRNIQGYTGKSFMNRRSDNGHGDDLVNVLKAHDLFAVDSLLRPKRSHMFCNQHKRVCDSTYLQKDKSLHPKNLITITFSFLNERMESKSLRGIVTG